MPSFRTAPTASPALDKADAVLEGKLSEIRYSSAPRHPPRHPAPGGTHQHGHPRLDSPRRPGSHQDSRLRNLHAAAASCSFPPTSRPPATTPCPRLSSAPGRRSFPASPTASEPRLPEGMRHSAANCLESIPFGWYGFSMKQRKKQPLVTRQLILNAAGEDFATHGYSGTGLGSIVSKSGLTKGALFHHFPDKRALALAWISGDLSGFYSRPMDHPARWDRFPQCVPSFLPHTLFGIPSRRRHIRARFPDGGNRRGGSCVRERIRRNLRQLARGGHRTFGTGKIRRLDPSFHPARRGGGHPRFHFLRLECHHEVQSGRGLPPCLRHRIGRLSGNTSAAVMWDGL